LTFTIKVPASTANLGPGFDSVGLALNRHLVLSCTSSDQWRFRYQSPGYETLPTDHNNFIYRIYRKTASIYGFPDPEPAVHIDITTDIPLERGLGSSAAAIVAGIELANYLLGLQLTTAEKARLASCFEGHPDNAGASVYGGLTVGTHSEEDTVIIPCGVPPIDVILMIPDNHLLTEASRNLLPERLDFYEAVRGSSLANVLVACLVRGDIEKLSHIMACDVFHQPYRIKAVPDLETVTAYLSGEPCGVALSGAGPSIAVLTEKNKGEAIREKLAHRFPDYTIDLLHPESQGACMYEGR